MVTRISQNTCYYFRFSFNHCVLILQIRFMIFNGSNIIISKCILSLTLRQFTVYDERHITDHPTG